jgi:cytochrome c-type biogenesis protein CcmH/NrfG
MAVLSSVDLEKRSFAMRRFACLLLIAIANAGYAQDETWVGKTVITKYHGVGITGKDEKGNDAIVGKLNDSISYRVKAQRGNRIQVQTTDGIEGWLDKADALLPALAIGHFTDEIKRDKSNASALQKRAFALAWAGKLDDAIIDANEAIHLAYNDPASWNQLGALHLAKKDYDRAVQNLTRAIKLNPYSAAFLSNRGYAWIGKKEYGKAIADLDEAIFLEPRLAYAYNNRGLARFLKKDYEEARKDFAEAEKLDPENAALCKNRAWMMATCADAKYRDGKKAVTLASKAIDLADNPDGDFYLAEAAAYAETANFAQAVRLLERMQTDPRWTKDSGVRQQLELHRQKKAVRQE